MSNKFLSKSAWEAQLKKHSLEEKTLSKALAAYEKAEGDAEAEGRTLAEIEKVAAALKKQKELKPVLDYVGDVVEAAGAAQKELEKKGGDEEGEDGEMTADLGKHLKAALAKVKALAPAEGESPDEGRPQMKFMAYAVGRDCALVVARKVGSSTKKVVAELAGGSGGKYFTGDCIFEKNAYTFVMESPAAGLAKKFSRALLAETEQKYKVRVRSVDGSMELDDETDGAAEGEAGAPVPPPPPSAGQVDVLARLKALKPDLDKAIAAKASEGDEAKRLFVALAGLVKGGQTADAAGQLPALEALLAKALSAGAPGDGAGNGDGEAAFKARLTALLPKVKEALAAGSPAAVELRAKTGEAAALGKEKNFTGAGAALDAIEKLLGGGGAAGAGPSPAETFKQRVAALMPAIKEAMAAGSPAGQAIRAKAAEAGALGKAEDFAKANAALDEVEIMLGRPASGAAAGGPKDFSIVALQKSRLEWGALRQQVQTDLQALEKAVLDGVRDHNRDEEGEDEFEEGEVAGGVKELYTILEKLDERLTDKLDEALNAPTDEERRARHAEAAGIIKEYQSFAQSDPMLAFIDENGFLGTSIRAQVTSTLANLAGKF